MASPPVSTSTLLTLEERAQKLVEKVEADKLTSSERLIELLRWVAILFVFLPLNMVATTPPTELVMANGILIVWAVFNFLTVISFSRDKWPSSNMRDIMSLLDVMVAGGFLYLQGVNSGAKILFFFSILAIGLRCDFRVALGWTALIAGVYVGILSYLEKGIPSNILEVGSQVFLFFIGCFAVNILVESWLHQRAQEVAATIDREHEFVLESKEIERMKGQFVQLASHEFRTPIAKIKGWLHIFDKAQDSLPELMRQEGVAEMRQQTEHLQKLTDNLLRISQIDAGEIKIRLKPLAVKEAVDEALGLFPEALNNNRVLYTQVDHLPDILADKDRVVLVLTSLIDNALKFSPKQQQVKINTKVQSSYIIIEVHDAGRRIPDEQADKVFASFYQVESPLVRQREGLGIGLYLARQLIEHMGGKIWLDNEKVWGNTFAFRLPIANTWNTESKAP